MSPIPSGSTVLVTGANGYLASHVVDQLLAAGYKVKGTVRSEAKGEWLLNYFNKKYGPDRLSLEIVPDMSATDAFHKALQGCAGVAHVASDLSFSANPSEVIPGVEAAITNILSSTARVASVKRFVLTSSSVAAVFPRPDQKFRVPTDSWNELSEAKAWETDKEGEGERAFHVYAASKVASEKALWKFMVEKKPAFEANAVLPSFITGKVLGREWGQAGSTGGAVVNLYAGNEEMVKQSVGFLSMVPPQYQVDADDTARLHCAALTDPDVVSERIWAFNEPYNNEQLLAVLRKAKPGHEFPGSFGHRGHDLSITEGRDRAEEILNKNFGHGFTTLEQSLKNSIEGL